MLLNPEYIHYVALHGLYLYIPELRVIKFYAHKVGKVCNFNTLIITIHDFNIRDAKLNFSCSKTQNTSKNDAAKSHKQTELYFWSEHANDQFIKLYNCK